MKKVRQSEKISHSNYDTEKKSLLKNRAEITIIRKTEWRGFGCAFFLYESRYCRFFLHQIVHTKKNRRSAGITGIGNGRMSGSLGLFGTDWDSLGQIVDSQGQVGA